MSTVLGEALRGGDQSYQPGLCPEFSHLGQEGRLFNREARAADLLSKQQSIICAPQVWVLAQDTLITKGSHQWRHI